MKHPTPQEIMDNCELGRWLFVEWYNFRLKELNPKPFRGYGRNYGYDNTEKGGNKNNMTSLKEIAKEYIPQQTLNVADLDRVDLSLPMEDRVGQDLDGKEFKYKVIVMNNQEYRVPNTVIEEIQKILKLKPEAKAVKVTKTGTGLNTRYSVEFLE